MSFESRTEAAVGSGDYLNLEDDFSINKMILKDVKDSRFKWMAWAIAGWVGRMHCRCIRLIKRRLRDE